MIELENVVFERDGRRIVDGISLTVPKGEAVALVGPNGSGKTSLLRCMLGLVPFEGRVRLGGVDVRLRPVEALAQVGYLPQRAAFGDAPALEVLVLAARLRGLEPGRAAAVLAQVGLAEHARKRVRLFSGGMLQRLSLALVLLADPPVLLLDEPTASLDREGQQAFLELATRYRSEGRTMVITSHRAEDLGRLAGRVIEVDRGRLLLPTPPEREPTAPATPGRPLGTGAAP